MEFLLIILGFAGLVWGAIFATRGSVIAGCLVYFVLLSCFGHEFLKFDLGPIAMSIDRLFILGMCGVYFLQRSFGLTEPKPLTRADWAYFGFLAVVVASTAVQKMLGNGLEGAPGTKNPTPIVIHLINGYIIPAMLYWMARQSRVEARQMRWLLGGAALFGLYLACTGIAEFHRQWGVVFPRYIANPEIGLHYGRARGPMVQSVSYGLYLGTCWILLLAWRAHLGRWGQMLIVLLSPVFLLGIYYTHTRSVWMGTMLGMVLVLWLTLEFRWRVLVLGSIFTVGLIGGLTNLERIVSLERGDNNAASTRESAHLRKSFAYVSWQMFLDRPLLGVGFGQFARDKIPYLDDRSVDLQLDPIRDWSHHNTYLSLLTELGATGLILFVLTLTGWTFRAWRLANNPQADPWFRSQGTIFLGGLGVYVLQALFHDVTFTPLDNSLLCFLAGLAMGRSVLTTAPHSGWRTQPAWTAVLPGAFHPATMELTVAGRSSTTAP